MSEQYKTIEERLEERAAERAARPILVKALDSTLSFLRYRLPEKVSHICAAKYPLEKEHRQVGFTYWDRPKKIHDFWEAQYTIAWAIYPKLVRFRHAEKVGVPVDFVDEEGELSEAAWLETIDQMIYAFQEIINDDIILQDNAKEIQDKINQGLSLFAKYFQSLWD